ncbi:MAG: TonB-dependent receptor [Gemmatimonadaceae bacterium]|nr:TonB-dependent receptor [Gemmatimonadaceae bacterium]
MKIRFKDRPRRTIGRARQLACAFVGAMVLAFHPTDVSAQGVGAIRGVVVDAASGAPVPAALVRLAERHRAEPTHDDGAFVLRNVPAGSYALTVQRLGYSPQTRTVEVIAGDTVAVRIELQQAAVRLGPQVVTGTITSRAGEEILSPASVLSEAQLERQLSTTVASTLDGTPGVSVSAIGASTGRPVIRGLGGDRILVLEDGQRSGDLSALSGDHAVAVDPLSAKQIEVVRGPMSLLYGSSALGGVVNVIREEIPASIPEHAHGTLSVQGESALRSGTAGGEVRTRLADNLAARVEGTLRRSGSTRTPVGTLTNTDAQTYGAAAGLGYNQGATHAGISYRYYASDYGIPGGFVGGHAGGVDISMRRHALRGEAERHFGDDGPITARATGTFTDYGHSELEKNGDLGTRYDQRLSTGELLIRHDSVGPLALGALGVRGQFRDIVTGGSLRTPSTSDYNAALYMVEEFGHRALRLQVGARYDHSRYTPRGRRSINVGGTLVPIRPRTFGAFSGSAGLLYAFAPGWRVGSSVSRGYRTPDFNELYSNGPHLAANAFEVGDPELRQETGIGTDVFLRVNRPRVRVEIAAFRNQLDDYITATSRGRAILSAQGQPLFQYTNEDAVYAGAEGEVEWNLTRTLALDITVSHVQARFPSERQRIPVFSFTETSFDTTFVPASQYPSFVPPTNGRVELHHDGPRLHGSGGVRFAARQARTGDFETSTPGFAVGFATVGYRFLRRSQFHTVTLRADNILNTEYREHLSRIKEIMPEPGRNISLLYRLSF